MGLLARTNSPGGSTIFGAGLGARRVSGACQGGSAVHADLSGGIQGGFFLRKTPLSFLAPGYSD